MKKALFATLIFFALPGLAFASSFTGDYYQYSGPQTGGIYKDFYNGGGLYTYATVGNHGSETCVKFGSTGSCTGPQTDWAGFPDGTYTMRVCFPSGDPNPMPASPSDNCVESWSVAITSGHVTTANLLTGGDTIGPLSPGVVVATGQSTTTASTTVTFSIPYSIPGGDFDHLGYFVLDQSYSKTATTSPGFGTSAGGYPVSGTGTFTFTMLLQNGHQYTWYAFLLASSTGAGLDSDQYVFWAGANGVAGVPVVGSLESYAIISATTTCDLTNLSGCFQNALTWAFYPPNGSFDGILSLKDLVSRKPPFGYFTVAQQQISALGTSTSPAFALESVAAINQYIFGPLDTGLAAIWWAIFGIWFFFHRARHIEI